MIRKKILGIVFVCLGLMSFVSGQYFFFSGGSSNGFQQGCSETYDIYYNTESITGITIGQIAVQLDDSKIDYEHSRSQSNIFSLKAGMVGGFAGWVPDFPRWIAEYTKILIAAKNENGVLGIQNYGNFIFTPKFNSTGYDVDFLFIYDETAGRTTLSRDGMNIINSGEQNQRLTGTISVLQQPCEIDNNIPTVGFSYANVTTLNYNKGLAIELKDNVGSTNVPYVFTGNNVWTGNVWGVNNQYGVDLSDIVVVVTGTNNGYNEVILYSGDFAITSINSKTWQYLDRDYRLEIDSGSLFDFGIEEPVTIYIDGVKDRAGNLKPRTQITMNNPVAPTFNLQMPANNASYIPAASKVSFRVLDDWAGVDTGSVVVVLSGINASASGYRYVFSGSDLKFTKVSGDFGLGNSGGYLVEINSHEKFPADGKIRVDVSASDLKGTSANTTWSFTASPNCSELACCSVDILLGENGIETYPNEQLYIQGGNNPTINTTLTEYTVSGVLYTGWIVEIDCNVSYLGLTLFSGTHDDFTLVASEIVGSELYLSGDNDLVTAELSGDTLILGLKVDDIVLVGDTPSSGQHLNAGNINFTWHMDEINLNSDYSRISGYVVNIYSGGDLILTGLVTGRNNTSWSVNLPDGEYEWNVYAFDKLGHMGVASDALSFVVAMNCLDTWNNDNFLSSEFWNSYDGDTDTGHQQVICALYGSGREDKTAYTKGRSGWDTTQCSGINMTVVETEFLPIILAPNTIYVLTTGDVETIDVMMNNCSAIVSKNGTVLSATVWTPWRLNGSGYSYSYITQYAILDNLSFEGNNCLDTSKSGSNSSLLVGFEYYGNNNSFNNIRVYNHFLGVALGGENNNLNNIQSFDNVYGIRLLSGNNNSLNNIQSYYNGVGIRLFSGNNNILNNIQSYNNYYGIGFHKSNYNKLNNIQIYNNSGCGVSIQNSIDNKYYGNFEIFGNTNSYCNDLVASEHVSQHNESVEVVNAEIIDAVFGGDTSGDVQEISDDVQEISDDIIPLFVESQENTGDITSSIGLITGLNEYVSLGWMPGQYVDTGIMSRDIVTNPKDSNGNYLFEWNSTSWSNLRWTIYNLLSIIAPLQSQSQSQYDLIYRSRSTYNMLLVFSGETYNVGNFFSIRGVCGSYRTVVDIDNSLLYLGTVYFDTGCTEILEIYGETGSLLTLDIGNNTEFTVYSSGQFDRWTYRYNYSYTCSSSYISDLLNTVTTLNFTGEDMTFTLDGQSYSGLDSLSIVYEGIACRARVPENWADIETDLEVEDLPHALPVSFYACAEGYKIYGDDSLLTTYVPVNSVTGIVSSQYRIKPGYEYSSGHSKTLNITGQNISFTLSGQSYVAGDSLRVVYDDQICYVDVHESVPAEVCIDNCDQIEPIQPNYSLSFSGCTGGYEIYGDDGLLLSYISVNDTTVNITGTVNGYEYLSGDINIGNTIGRVVAYSYGSGIKTQAQPVVWNGNTLVSVGNFDATKYIGSDTVRKLADMTLSTSPTSGATDVTVTSLDSSITKYNVYGNILANQLGINRANPVGITLAGGDGQKIVVGQIYTPDGYYATHFQETITKDTTPPSCEILVGCTLASGCDWCSNWIVPLVLSGSSDIVRYELPYSEVEYFDIDNARYVSVLSHTGDFAGNVELPVFNRGVYTGYVYDAAGNMGYCTGEITIGQLYSGEVMVVMQGDEGYECEYITGRIAFQTGVACTNDSLDKFGFTYDFSDVFTGFVSIITGVGYADIVNIYDNPYVYEYQKIGVYDNYGIGTLYGVSDWYNIIHTGGGVWVEGSGMGFNTTSYDNFKFTWLDTGVTLDTGVVNLGINTGTMVISAAELINGFGATEGNCGSGNVVITGCTASETSPFSCTKASLTINGNQVIITGNNGVYDSGSCEICFTDNEGRYITSGTVVFDVMTKGPSVVLTGTNEACMSTGIFSVTGTFSVPVDDFDSTGDINVAYGVAYNFSGADDVYTWDIIMNPLTDVKVRVPADVAKERVGGVKNMPSNILTGMYDNAGPTGFDFDNWQSTIYADHYTFSWTTGVDQGCAGISGYNWELRKGTCDDIGNGDPKYSGHTFNLSVSLGGFSHDDTYCLWVEPVDDFGNTGNAITGEFKVDTTEIGCSIEHVDSCTGGADVVYIKLMGSYSGGDVYVSWDSTGDYTNTGIIYTGLTAYSQIVTGYISQPGTNRWNICTGMADKIDVFAPEITDLSGVSVPECTTGWATVEAVDSGCAGIHNSGYNWNGLGYQGSNKFEARSGGIGTQLVSIQVQDNYGNSTGTTVTISWTNSAISGHDFTGSENVGNTPKTGDWRVLSEVSDGDCGSGTVYYSGIVQDGSHGNCTRSGDEITYTPNTSYGYEGSDSCVIEVIDDEDSTKQITIYWGGIDTKAPSCTLTVQAGQACTSGDVTMVINSADAISYSFDGINFGNTTTGSVDSLGVYTGYVRDSYGNQGQCTGEIDNTVLDLDNPTLQVSNWTGYECTTGTIIVTGNDNSCGIIGLQYNWTLAVGYNFSNSNSIYSGNVGSQTVQVSVIDGVGHTTSQYVTYTWIDNPVTGNNFTTGNVGSGVFTVNWIAGSNAHAGNCETITGVLIATGNKGVCVQNGNDITYTPNQGQTGSDTCTLTVSDDDGSTDITITFTGIDTLAPTVSLSGDNLGCTTQVGWTVTGNFSEGVTGVNMSSLTGENVHISGFKKLNNKKYVWTGELIGGTGKVWISKDGITDLVYNALDDDSNFVLLGELDITGPSKVQLSSPVSGHIFNTTDVTLSWNASTTTGCAQLSGYELEICGNVSMDSGCDTTALDSSETVWSGIKQNGTYYRQMVAIDENGNTSELSEIRMFVVDSEQPQCVITQDEICTSGDIVLYLTTNKSGTIVSHGGINWTWSGNYQWTGSASDNITISGIVLMGTNGLTGLCADYTVSGYDSTPPVFSGNIVVEQTIDECTTGTFEIFAEDTGCAGDVLYRFGSEFGTDSRGNSGMITIPRTGKITKGGVDIYQLYRAKDGNGNETTIQSGIIHFVDTGVTLDTGSIDVGKIEKDLYKSETGLNEIFVPQEGKFCRDEFITLTTGDCYLNGELETGIVLNLNSNASGYIIDVSGAKYITSGEYTLLSNKHGSGYCEAIFSDDEGNVVTGYIDYEVDFRYCFDEEWNNDYFLTPEFWELDPSDEQVICALYGSMTGSADDVLYDSTAYTIGWNDEIPTKNCGIGTYANLSEGRMQVVWTNTLPPALSEKTVYVLTSTGISLTSKIELPECTAIVSSQTGGRDTVLKNTSIVIEKEGGILDNISVDGYGCAGSCSTTSKISSTEGHTVGILISGTQNNTLNVVKVYRNGVGVLMTDSHNNVLNNLQLYANTWGIDFADSDRNAINNTQIYYNKVGASFEGSHENIFSNVEIYGHTTGLRLVEGSTGNIFHDMIYYNSHANNQSPIIEVDTGLDNYYYGNNTFVRDTYSGTVYSECYDDSDNYNIHENDEKDLNIYLESQPLKEYRYDTVISTRECILTGEIGSQYAQICEYSGENLIGCTDTNSNTCNTTWQWNECETEWTLQSRDLLLKGTGNPYFGDGMISTSVGGRRLGWPRESTITGSEYAIDYQTNPLSNNYLFNWDKVGNGAVGLVGDVKAYSYGIKVKTQKDTAIWSNSGDAISQGGKAKNSDYYIGSNVERVQGYLDSYVDTKTHYFLTGKSDSDLVSHYKLLKITPVVQNSIDLIGESNIINSNPWTQNVISSFANSGSENLVINTQGVEWRFSDTVRNEYGFVMQMLTPDEYFATHVYNNIEIEQPFVDINPKNFCLDLSGTNGQMNMSATWRDYQYYMSGDLDEHIVQGAGGVQISGVTFTSGWDDKGRWWGNYTWIGIFTANTTGRVYVNPNIALDGLDIPNYGTEEFYYWDAMGPEIKLLVKGYEVSSDSSFMIDECRGDLLKVRLSDYCAGNSGVMYSGYFWSSNGAYVPHYYVENNKANVGRTGNIVEPQEIWAMDNFGNVSYRFATGEILDVVPTVSCPGTDNPCDYAGVLTGQMTIPAITTLNATEGNCGNIDLVVTGVSCYYSDTHASYSGTVTITTDLRGFTITTGDIPEDRYVTCEVIIEDNEHSHATGYIKFRVDTVPPECRIESGTQQTCTNGYKVLTMNHSGGAVKYSRSGFDDLSTINGEITGLVTENGPVYCFVEDENGNRGTNSDDVDAYVETLIDNDGPTGLVLHYPTSGSELNDSAVSFAWYDAINTGCAKLSGYTFYLSTGDGNDFEANIIRSAALGNITGHVETSLADGTYYWRVKVEDELGQEFTSDIWMFTIKYVPLTCDLTGYALDGSLCTTGDVTVVITTNKNNIGISNSGGISWTKSGDYQRYAVVSGSLGEVSGIQLINILSNATGSCPAYSMDDIYDVEGPDLSGGNALTGDVRECSGGELTINVSAGSGCADVLGNFQYKFGTKFGTGIWQNSNVLSVSALDAGRTGGIVQQDISVQDALGNESTGTFDIEVKDILPTITGRNLGVISGAIVVSIDGDANEGLCGTGDLFISDIECNGATRSTGEGLILTITPNNDLNKVDGYCDVTVKDNEGNTATGRYEFTGDTVGPDVELTGTNLICMNTGVFSVTGTFTEDVYGFTDAGVSVQGGIVSDFVDQSLAIYTWKVSMNALQLVSVVVPAGVAVDLGGNSNTASNTLSGEYDPKGPDPVTLTAPGPVVYGNNTTLKWTSTTDSGCAGVSGYYWEIYSGECDGGDFLASGFIASGADLSVYRGGLVGGQSYCRGVEPIDNFGNVGTRSTGSFVVDLSNIGCEIEPIDDYTSCTSGSITVRLSGANDYTTAGVVYLSWQETGDWHNSSYLDTGLADEGQVVYGYIYQPATNRTGVCVYTASNVIDQTAPEISGFSLNATYVPECNTGTASVVAFDSGCDKASNQLWYKWEGMGDFGNNSSLSLYSGSAGSRTVNVQVRDSAWNITSGDVVFTWTNSAISGHDFTGSENVGNTPKTGDWRVLSEVSDGDCGSGTVYYSGIVQDGSHGNCTRSGDEITYTPNTVYSGTDSCTIEVRDDENTTKQITIYWGGIDTMGPSCTISYSPVACTSGDVELTVSANEILSGVVGGGIDWSINGDLATGIVNSNGEVSVIVTDELGNTGSCSTGIYNISTGVLSAPEGLSPISGTKTNQTSFGFAWSGVSNVGCRTVSGYEYQICKDLSCANESNIVSLDIASYDTGLSDGTYYWRVRTVDNLGGKSEWTEAVLIINTQEPTCTISYNPACTSGTVALSLTGNDDLYYSWTGISYTGTDLTNIISTNGTYTGYVRDDFGNTGSCNTGVNNIKTGDLSKPEGLTPISGSRVTTTTPTLSWSGVVPGTDTCRTVSGYNYRICRDSACADLVENGSSNSTSWTTETLDDGTYYWSVQTVDDLGGETEWTEALLIVDTTAPSCEIKVNTPEGGCTSGEVEITLSGNSSEISTYSRWDMVTGTFIGNVTTGVDSIGTYTGYVWDAAGNTGICTGVVTNEILDTEGLDDYYEVVDAIGYECEMITGSINVTTGESCGSDDISDFVYQRLGSEITTNKYGITHNGVYSGTYYVKIRNGAGTSVTTGVRYTWNDTGVTLDSGSIQNIGIITGDYDITTGNIIDLFGAIEGACGIENITVTGGSCSGANVEIDNGIITITPDNLNGVSGYCEFIFSDDDGRSETGTLQFSVDNVAPGLVGENVLTFSGGACVKGGISYTVTATWNELVVGFDISDVVVTSGTRSSNFTATNNPIFGWTVTSPSDGVGVTTVTISSGAVSDGAGFGNPEKSISREYDNAGPVDVTFSDWQDTIYDTEVVLSWDGSDDNGCAGLSGYNYKFTSGTSCTLNIISSGFKTNTSLSVNGLSNGKYTLCVQPVDKLGNEGSWTSKTFTVDLNSIACVIEQSQGCSTSGVILTLKQSNQDWTGISLSWSGYDDMVSTGELTGWFTELGLVVTGYIKQQSGSIIKKASCTGIITNIDHTTDGPSIAVVPASGPECTTITGSVSVTTGDSCGRDELEDFRYKWNGNTTGTNTMYEVTSNVVTGYSVRLVVSDGIGNTVETGVQFTWNNTPISANNFTGSESVGNGKKTTNWRIGSEATDGLCGSGSENVMWSGFISTGTHGECTRSGDEITYTPNEGSTGEDYCEIEIKDDEGSVTQVTIYWGGIDTVAPICEISYNPVCTSGGVILTVTGNEEIQTIIGGGINRTITGFIATGTVNVNGNISVIVTDEAGNTGVCSTGIYNISTGVLGAPSGLSPISGTVTNNTKPTLSWSGVVPGTDTCRIVSGYNYRICSDENCNTVVDSGSSNSTSWTTETLDDGTYYWSVQTVDDLGGKSEWTEALLIVDTTAPSCEIIVDTLGGGCTSGEVEITLSGNSSEISTYARWDMVTGTFTGNVTTGVYSTGTYTGYVWDAAGNTGICTGEVTNKILDTEGLDGHYEVVDATGYECETIIGSVNVTTGESCGSDDLSDFMYDWGNGFIINNERGRINNGVAGEIINVTIRNGAGTRVTTGVRYTWNDTGVTLDSGSIQNIGIITGDYDIRTGSIIDLFGAIEGACGIENITVTGGSCSGASVEIDNGTITITPDNLNGVSGYCEFIFSDDDGRTETGTLRFSVDNVAPTVGLSGGVEISGGNQCTNVTGFTITGIFTEPVQGVTINSLTGENVNIVDFDEIDDSTYVWTVELSGGTGKVWIVSSDITDMNGNSIIGGMSTEYTVGLFDNISPDFVTLISPVSGATLTDLTVDFEWTESSDNCSEVSYSLYICEGNDGNCDSPIYTITGLTNTGYITGLNVGKYYWKVGVEDSYGNSGVTDAQWFEITGPEYVIKAYPGSRSTGNLANYGEVRFYSGMNFMYKFVNVYTNEYGTGMFTGNIATGVYTVVYKGQSHLASYLTGVEVTGGTSFFDFTTGDNLMGTQNRSLAEDNGYQYQIAGDLKAEDGRYDFTVNGNDISIITANGFEPNVSHLDPRNLNGDTAVDVMDLTIVGSNAKKTDLFYSYPNVAIPLLQFYID